MTRGFFPFDTIRDGQAAFLADGERAFKQKEILLAYAPTGIGKTAAALSAALAAKKQGQVIFFLTSRQTQHAVVIETINQIRQKNNAQIKVIDLIGKQDMCAVTSAKKMNGGEFQSFCALSRKEKSCGFFPIKLDCAKAILETPHHAEQSIHTGKMFRSCPYYTSFSAGKEADIIVADYNYVFSPNVNQNILKRLGKSLSDILLIVDEAHNLPERIKNNHTYRLDAYLLANAVKEAKKVGEATPKLIRGLQTLHGFMNQGGEFGEKKLSRDEWLFAVNEYLSKSFLAEFTIPDLVAELQELEGKVQQKDREASDDGESQSAVDLVLSFLEKWCQRGNNWCRVQKGSKIELIDLDTAYHGNKVFKAVHGAILMSGTLYPPEDYAKMTGMNGLNHHCKSYDSSFPTHHRQVIVDDRTSTKFSKRSDELFEQMASIIQEVEQNIPGNVAIFFPSYDLLRRTQEKINTKRELLVESSGMEKKELQQFVKTLTVSQRQLLLAVNGGSLSEGIDFTQNSLKGIIVVGLPLAPPSVELTESITFLNQKYGNGHELAYLLPATNKVLQAAGRTIRTENDKGIIVLLDERFKEQSIQKMLPPSFTKVIQNRIHSYESVQSLFSLGEKKA